MRYRRQDFEQPTPNTRGALVALLNTPDDTIPARRQELRLRLDSAVAAQRDTVRRRLKELQTTAHVVKKGDWGLIDVEKPGVGSKRKSRARWTRGSGKRWPLKDAERYAKMFGGTVTRFP
jgi:hypothetical protein